MIVLLASVNAFKAEKFLLSVSSWTGSHEITKTKLKANSPRILKTCVSFKEDLVRGTTVWEFVLRQKQHIDNQSSRMILDFPNA